MIMKHKLAWVIALLLPAQVLFAQMSKADFNAKFFEANQLIEEKLWNSSIEIWKEILLGDPYNANVNYKIGYCYLQTSNEKLKALPHLKTATTNGVSLDYVPYEPAENRAPVEALFYLGRVFHLNYQMDEAIKSYNDLISMLPEKHFLRSDAKRQIEMCEEAKKQVADPKSYLISNVGGTVNSRANEYSPVISIDETAMFFTARKIRADSTNQFISDLDTGEPKEDIYVSYKDQAGNWMTPELLNINTDAHAATISVAGDGQTLYIYYDEEGNGQIYQSVLIGETWTTPELMGSDINSDAWETHVTVSGDGSALYFVSNRDGGSGGRDIYRCLKMPNGEWSKALSVGPAVNTPYEEDSPFISPDGRTLYFASTGHKSMGGFDVFYSNMGEDGEWSEPVNMGYPLNTVDDDLFFVPTADGRRAYYSSRKEEGYGLKDIYVIELPEPMATDLSVLKGYIFAPEGEELPNDTYVLVTNKNTGEVTEYRPRQRDGAYVAILPPCIAYHIKYVVNGKIVHEEFVNVPCESAYNEIEKEIYLLPLYLGDGKKVYEVTIEDPKDKTKEPIVVKIDEPIGTGYDPKEPVKSTYEEELGVAEFERYFVYDFHEFGAGEKLFVEFVNNVGKILDKKGAAEVYIESSASQVPSSRFKNNQELTSYRAETCKKQIIEMLTKRDYDTSKVKFVTPKAAVGGPDYKNDAIKNRLVYEQFQFVKARAK